MNWRVIGVDNVVTYPHTTLNIPFLANWSHDKVTKSWCITFSQNLIINVALLFHVADGHLKKACENDGSHLTWAAIFVQAPICQTTYYCHQVEAILHHCPQQLTTTFFSLWFIFWLYYVQSITLLPGNYPCVSWQPTWSNLWRHCQYIEVCACDMHGEHASLHAIYVDVITWKHFLHYCPFVSGIHWCGFLSQRACNAELWCFLYCYPEQTVEQAVELLVIWDAMTLMWLYCNDYIRLLTHLPLVRWGTESPLIQVMACRPFGAKP